VLRVSEDRRRGGFAGRSALETKLMQKLPSFRQMPFVATKLRPPANTASVVERPRLLEALERSVTRKVAWIHGPAGFGKTTLAVQWHAKLKERGATVGWLAVDAGDNELGRFLAYVVEAIRMVEPDIGSGLTGLIESNPEGVTELVVGKLINEFQVYDREFVLFLDDWHLIRSATIHEAIDLLLSRVPSNFHLVVTSRSRSNVSLARLRVQDALVEIGAADLRFDYNESSCFLEGAKALKLDADDVKALWRSTEGWIAALQLASISLRRSGDRQPLLTWATGTPNDVAEYLTENVLTTLPDPLVAFMLKTSVLGRLSPSLCCAVTGEAASADYLDQLERHELFLLPLDDERQWFRYHHLFAKFLQRRLERDHPAQVRSLHMAAAHWFSGNGQTAEALGHALAAGDTQCAIDMVEKDAMSLMQHSYMATLLGLVAQLPRALLFQRSTLQMAVAWANCLSHHPLEAEEALSHVERVAASTDGQAGELLTGEANIIRCCSAVYGDRIDSLDAMVQPCLAESASYPPWVVGVAANILTYRLIHTNELERVAPLQMWARVYQDRAEGSFSGVYGRCFSGMAAVAAADLLAAKRYFLDALVLARDSAGGQSHAAKLAGALLGQLQYEMNELEDACQLLEESRVLGFEGGVVDFYMATYIASARLKIQKGDYIEAAAILGEGENTARHLRLDRLGASIAAEQVRLSLLQGDRMSAQRALSDFDAHWTGEEPVASGVASQIWETLHLARARLLADQGHAEEAISILRGLSRRARDSGRLYMYFGVSVVLATACDAAGHASEAEDILVRAVTEGGRRGLMRSFLDEGPKVIVVLERLREKARRQQGASNWTTGFGACAGHLIAVAKDPERGMSALSRASDQEPGDRRAATARPRFDDALKPREIEILRYLDQGRSNKEIARTLSISVDTVKWYLKAVFSKLDVTRRGQAIAEARRVGLLHKV